MAVKNLHRQYADVQERILEMCSHHESLQATTDRKETHIQAMMTHIEEIGSPLSSQDASKTLANLVTKEVMPEDIKNDMLNAFAGRSKKYLVFRKERFIEKATHIGNTIHCTHLRTMNAIRTKPQKTNKTTVKERNIAESNIDIARGVGLTTEELLKYDVAPSTVMFDDGGIMTKPGKTLLIKELETHPCTYNRKTTPTVIGAIIAS